MNALARTAILTAAIVFDAHSVAFAQKPDSSFTVIHENSTLLRLNTDAGFVVRGTSGVGEIPAAGEGVRMMWFPARWAFRAGKVDSYGATYWDLERIGMGSMALGVNARASGDYSFATGLATIASGFASVALGHLSTASGDSSFAAIGGQAKELGTVAIGSFARAMGESALALGQSSTSSGMSSVAIGPNTASGFGALGVNSTASGDLSVAIGWGADTNGKRGAMVFADHCGAFPTARLTATAENQFVARACGGVKIYTDNTLDNVVEITPGGGSWSSISDVNRKENFEALDGDEVLLRLRDVPVMTWNYKSQDAEIRHAGPTAQDFHAAFGLGESELAINTIDIDGINMAAAKALEERTARQQARIEELEARLARHEALLADQAERSQ